MGRDRTFQAILPLRGKIINSEKNRINKVLSNNEIQAMITAIGTGIGDEFDIAKLRYHRIIVMTDADVDGSHIRTLILTFLYRHMPELFDRGHVYIAVPPLYKVKIGNQEFYFEKDAQLEELLVRERVGDVEIRPRSGDAVKMTESRWGKFTNALEKFEGWLQRLRADFGYPAADFMVTHRLVETDTPTLEAFGKAIEDGPENGYTLSARRTGRTASSPSRSSRTRRAPPSSFWCPASLLESPVYGQVRPATRVWSSSSARRRSPSEPARSSAPPRPSAGCARTPSTRRRRASSSRRFKGLGEMNADQLWDTTMDPQKRLLVRVDVEDASAADRLFSTLMGDQVEPRREFIETNAKDVRFLDV